MSETTPRIAILTSLASLALLFAALPSIAGSAGADDGSLEVTIEYTAGYVWLTRTDGSLNCSSHREDSDPPGFVAICALPEGTPCSDPTVAVALVAHGGGLAGRASCGARTAECTVNAAPTVAQPVAACNADSQAGGGDSFVCRAKPIGFESVTHAYGRVLCSAVLA